MEISKSGLQSGNPLELLKMSWLLNSKKLQDAFSKVQVQINNEDDLIALFEIAKNKLDVSGQIKDANDNPLMFDTIMILRGIKYTPQEAQNAQTFTYVE